jgi:hypothetical protein
MYLCGDFYSKIKVQSASKENIVAAGYELRAASRAATFLTGRKYSNVQNIQKFTYPFLNISSCFFTDYRNE